jgi:putative salt-induced outer membrane protein
MIEIALKGNDPATINAILTVARKAAPDSLPDIAVLERRYRDAAALAKADAARAARERLAQASPLSLWKGELELGGSQATGSAETAQLYGSIKLARPGLTWTQQITARADYGAAAHVENTEKFIASYQPQLRLGTSSYGYGLTEAEHDKFLGVRDRYTLGLGYGITPWSKSNFKVSIDAGPSLLFSQFYQRPAENSQIAARGTVKVRWVIRPDLTLTEEATGSWSNPHRSARATLSLDARVIGPLKARLSYNHQYERYDLLDQHQSDTVTRASLVYGF